MVPLGAVVKIIPSHGPDRVMRYNGLKTSLRRRPGSRL
jgi:hypothetical protein